MKSSRLHHNICCILYQWIPAILVDCLLFCLRYPPVYVPLLLLICNLYVPTERRTFSVMLKMIYNIILCRCCCGPTVSSHGYNILHGNTDGFECFNHIVTAMYPYGLTIDRNVLILHSSPSPSVPTFARRLCRVQRRVQKGYDVFEYYANNQWDFDNSNVLYLRTIINKTEETRYAIEDKGKPFAIRTPLFCTHHLTGATLMRFVFIFISLLAVDVVVVV